jgi:hypothetical protein
MRMEAIRSSETLVITYKTTRRHNPKDYNNPLSTSCFSCVIAYTPISPHIIQILNNNNNSYNYNYNSKNSSKSEALCNISLTCRLFTVGKC